MHHTVSSEEVCSQIPVCLPGCFWPLVITSEKEGQRNSMVITERRLPLAMSRTRGRKSVGSGFPVAMVSCCWHWKVNSCSRSRMQEQLPDRTAHHGSSADASSPLSFSSTKYHYWAQSHSRTISIISPSSLEARVCLPLTL